MNWPIVVLGCVLAAFAVGSAVREIRIYNRAVRGEVEFFVSRARRNRRLLVSGLLLLESVLLFAGTPAKPGDYPGSSLLYWTGALILMIVVILLALRDLRETRRDMDRLFQETMLNAIKKAREENRQ